MGGGGGEGMGDVTNDAFDVTNDALLCRPATIPVTRLFSCEGNLEYTGCGSSEH